MTFLDFADAHWSTVGWLILVAMAIVGQVAYAAVTRGRK